MKTTTPWLSRREFAGASALGGVAIASAAAPAQIMTIVTYEKLPPYGNNTLPTGVRPRLVPMNLPPVSICKKAWRGKLNLLPGRPE